MTIGSCLLPIQTTVRATALHGIDAGQCNAPIDAVAPIGRRAMAKPVLRRPVESAQYVSIRYSERPAEAGIEPSVGSRGDSYDNALAETINGLHKKELIHRRAPWKTRESVELATLEWAAWYNYHRLMEPLGYIPPAEADANYYRQLRNAADVSALT